MALWLGYYFVQSTHFYLDGWQHSKKFGARNLQMYTAYVLNVTTLHNSSFLHFVVFLISLTGVRCFSKQFFVTPQVHQREEKKENKRSGRQAYKVSYSLKLLKLGPVCTTTKYRVWCLQKTWNIL